MADGQLTQTNGNGHSVLVDPSGAPLPSYRDAEVADLAMQLRALETSVLFARSTFMRQVGLAFDDKRDYYAVFGYDRNLTAVQYRETYARGGIAKRIVEAFPKATWRGSVQAGSVQIYEDEDPEKHTVFETAFEELDKRLHIWSVLERADILAGLSTYSVILLGAPGNLETPLPKATNATKLLYLTPFWGGGGPANRTTGSTIAAEVDATIAEYDTDPKSERFGEPKFYQLKRTNINFSTEARRVHWTRIIHIAEGCLEDNVFGVPTLENVWNLLMDLLKVTGGGAEAFWLRANQGFHADIDKDMKLDDANLTLTKLREDMERYQHNLTRWLRTKGVSVNTLGSDVANFSGPADAILKQIAGSKGIPLRILTGSEQGQLASGQDAENWNSQVQDRRTSYAEPNIVRRFVDRLLDYGYLPRPKEYKVAWPIEEEMTEPQKADLAVKLASANATNANTGGIVITDAEIREKALGMKPLTDQQRKEINDRKAEEAAQAMKQQQEAMKAQAEANPQPPPADKDNVAPFQPRAAESLEPLVNHLTVAIVKQDYDEINKVVRRAAEWNEEDHPRDEKGQFAHGVGAAFGQHTAQTGKGFPGGVIPKPPPKRSERVVEGPPQTMPPPRERKGPPVDAKAAPDTTPDGEHVDTLTKPASVEGKSTHHGGGINESIEIRTEDGGHYLFKPKDGEAFGARAGVIDNRDMPLAEREVIASRFGHELGFSEVPNTFMAEYNDRIGSAQEWIEHASTGRGDFRDERARLGIFDAVIGNTDRHGGNALVDENGHLHAIDHGYTLGKTVPKDVAADGWNIHGIRSWALGGIRQGDLPVNEQKAIANKLDNLDFGKILHGSHIDTDEREALYERVSRVSERLAAGEAHLIKNDYEVDNF